MSFLKAMLLVATCYHVVMATDYARCDFGRFGYFFFEGSGSTLYRSGSFKVESQRRGSKFVNFNLYKPLEEVDEFATCLERVDRTRPMGGVSRYDLNGVRKIVETQIDTSHLDHFTLHDQDLESLNDHVIIANFEGSTMDDECCVIRVDNRYKNLMEMFEADQEVTPEGNTLKITNNPEPVEPTPKPYVPIKHKPVVRAHCDFIQEEASTNLYQVEGGILVDHVGIEVTRFSADIVRHTEQCVINPNDVIQHIFDSEEVHNPTSAYKFEFKTSKTIEELAGNTLIITDNTYENVDGTDEFIPRGIMHCCQIKMAVTQQMVDDWDPQG